ncbi:DeoR/GlpR family DNA-binding transcription regulator [Actinophytocola sp.]|uniref:DeoR/GlpR family DNA-binding transcription regulator n=1 Tax=Actinophytocola sp. TaxID=1872138 RepID=UPI003D6BA883
MGQGSGSGTGASDAPTTRLRRADRISAILERLSADQSLGVAELAESFGVSQATLRRDLQVLNEQRLVTRTHGGVLAQGISHELPVRYRDAQHKEQKLRIAAEACRRIPDGPIAVGLTGGTTTSEVARLLVDRVDLTVITNALNIAFELAIRPQVKLVVTGGRSRQQSFELVGPWAEHTLGGLNVGIAIVGTDGISADGGLTTHDEVEAQTNAALISRARRTIVVADGSKVGRVRLARIAALDDVDELITDDTADSAALDAVRGAGVDVTVV